MIPLASLAPYLVMVQQSHWVDRVPWSMVGAILTVLLCLWKIARYHAELDKMKTEMVTELTLVKALETLRKEMREEFVSRREWRAGNLAMEKKTDEGDSS